MYLLKNQTPTTETTQSEADYFFIKCEGKFEKILTDDILYIQSLQNYVIIYTTKGKFMTLMSLKSWEENLNSTQFIRVHKSYIVAINKVTRFEHSALQIEQQSIPISRANRDWVLEILLKNNPFQK